MGNTAAPTTLNFNSQITTFYPIFLKSLPYLYHNNKTLSSQSHFLIGFIFLAFFINA